MSNRFQILTIFGSPHDAKSNTRAYVADFLDDVEAEGLPIERRFISLGTETVRPCKGCWNCTMQKPCPIKDDAIEEIKEAMIDCDMLILACPVYTNQVSAQMKAFFDRLFTWCHVFPLLGKYALSAVTTGNDGHRETGDYLEKMLATYGTLSFGTIMGTGAYTAGFFPRRESERAKNADLARRVAKTILAGERPKIGKWNRKIFAMMKRKLSGIHAIHYIRHGSTPGQPDPPKMMVKLIHTIQKKRNIGDEQIDRLARLATFELDWWRSRGWLGTKSFDRLISLPVPEGFDAKERLLWAG